jgi:hypothetical protein
VITRPPPTWVDCHYLITAWSPDAEPSLRSDSEHRVLAGVIIRLRERSPLCPERLLPGAEVDALDPLLRSLDLPTEVAPPEGFSHLGDFWSSIGDQRLWRPAVHVVVTTPLLPDLPNVDGVVESILMDVGRPRASGPGIEGAEETLAIGGVVLTGPGGDPVAGVRVVFAPSQGARRTTTTGSDGRFSFDAVQRGQADLEWGAPGSVAGTRSVDVPSTDLDDYVLPLT